LSNIWANLDEIWANLGKIWVNYLPKIWAKSKSCIHKNIWSLTAMLLSILYS